MFNKLSYVRERPLFKRVDHQQYIIPSTVGHVSANKDELVMFSTKNNGIRSLEPKTIATTHQH